MLKPPPSNKYDRRRSSPTHMGDAAREERWQKTVEAVAYDRTKVVLSVAQVCIYVDLPHGWSGCTRRHTPHLHGWSGCTSRHTPHVHGDIVTTMHLAMCAHFSPSCFLLSDRNGHRERSLERLEGLRLGSQSRSGETRGVVKNAKRKVHRQ